MTEDLWYRTLDRARRLFLPRHWTARLGAGLRFAAGPDHSLLLLPTSTGTAASVTLRRHGRIVIPKPLADWARLDAGTECVLYASGTGLRLLRAETWTRAVLEEVG